MRSSDWNGPLTARQLVTIVVVLAALVGAFFYMRYAVRTGKHLRAVDACLAHEPVGVNLDCEQHPNAWKEVQH